LLKDVPFYFLLKEYYSVLCHTRLDFRIKLTLCKLYHVFIDSQQKALRRGLLFGLKPVNGLLEGNVSASDSNFS
jgi:hypothetical protein